MRILRMRRYSVMEGPDLRIIEYLSLARFYYVSQIQRFLLEPTLISALVERWRLETHMFHFSCGECMIILEDVELQLSLPVEGEAVTCLSISDDD